MLDDLRERAGEFSYLDDEDASPDYDEGLGKLRHFLGMTPVQRFVITVMLLFMTIILSAFFLLVTEKVAPPFLY